MTEKQLEAKRLYREYHSFQFTELKYIGHYGREATAHVCDINGYRCCLASDVGYLSECIRKCVELELLSRNDYLVGRRMDGGRYAGGRSCRVIKLDALKAIKDEYLKMRWSDSDSFDNYILCVESAEDVVSESISNEDIARIWELYDERQRLITEGTRERKEEKRREEMREAGFDIDEPGQEKDELGDLVDRIEALGWHVTLTRKEGA